MAEFKPLRLIAEGSEDLSVLSAALQDAVGQLGDFQYEAKARRFTLALNRYRWEDPQRGHGERVRSALQIGGVLDAKARRLKQGADDAVISLLALEFDPVETPGGTLRFIFSGGGELRLALECIDIVLADVSEPWRAAARPEHPDMEEGV